MTLTQAQKEELLEIEIRGRFMSMSADLEWVMLLIMTYLAPDPMDQSRKFKEMMLHNKIECLIADLKQYRMDLFEEYENDLLLLWDFKESRNDIGHKKMDFSEDLKSFRFLYVDIHKGKERIFEKKYATNAMLSNINVFRKLVLTLAELFQKMGGQQPTPVQ